VEVHLSSEVAHVAIRAPRHQFTVADYQRMGEAGILLEDDRVELIEGEIIDMSPIGRRHQACVDQLAERFFEALGRRVILRVQGSVRLSDLSEPQPDLAVLRRRSDFYAGSDAAPDDVLLIVEVADTTLHYDRDVKVPLYARARVPEAWVVDITGQRVLVYREPGSRGYATSLEAQGDDRLSLEGFPELVLTADDVVGGLA
jgi:Uma2 family endonuclease